MPRRAFIAEWCPAEKAISEAISKVEEMPADVRLTDAVVLLGEAKDSVADFVDGKARPVWREPISAELVTKLRTVALAPGVQGTIGKAEARELCLRLHLVAPSELEKP